MITAIRTSAFGRRALLCLLAAIGLLVQPVVAAASWNERETPRSSDSRFELGGPYALGLIGEYGGSELEEDDKGDSGNATAVSSYFSAPPQPTSARLPAGPSHALPCYQPFLLSRGPPTAS